MSSSLLCLLPLPCIGSIAFKCYILVRHSALCLVSFPDITLSPLYD